MARHDAKLAELRVNRSRFLLLTAAIAAGSCGGQQASADAPSTGGDFDTTASSSSVSVGEDEAEEDVATVEIPPPEPHEGEEAEEVEASPVRGAPCSDDVGTPGSCRSLRLPGPQCEQGMAINERECETLAKVLRPRVAEGLMRCLVERSNDPRDRCALNDAVVDCPEAALQNLCEVDPAYARDCRPIVDRCARRSWSQLSVESCQALLSAVKPSEQKTAITCMSEGCGTAHCVLDLAYRRVY